MHSYLKEYIVDKEFRMLILKNRIDIINYESIDQIESFKIVICGSNLKITITGDNLVVCKMLDEELLIAGNIKDINMGEV
jgi:hypothetical protein